MRKVDIAFCLTGCLTMQAAFGSMLVFRNLCMVKGPVEGADKKGHCLVMEKLGMIGDKVYGIPIYAYWNSGSNRESPYLGYGWHLPIAESCIVPLDANSFEMRRPDGCVELIVRDKKDKNKLRGRRYWQGEVHGAEIRIFTLKDCRHGQCELVFRNGRLVRFKEDGINAVLVYKGRELESMSFNGKEVIRLSQMAGKETKWHISMVGQNGVWLILGRTSVPLASGKEITVSALKEIVFSDGIRRKFTYGIDAKGNGTLRTPETRLVWDAKRRTIINKDDWAYEIRSPRPEWNNVLIRRVNRNGEAEGEYYDIQSGIQTKEIGRTKTIMRLFTSGLLKGKMRWCENYYDGVLRGRGEYAYDENGGLVYSKAFGRSASSTAGKKDMMERWFEPNGHVLRTRMNGDDSTIQEYIYAPDGRRTAVICGDRIVAECVGNAKEFVIWHKARQRGEKVVAPKVVEWQDVPLPEHIRKVIPPERLKELKDDGW